MHVLGRKKGALTIALALAMIVGVAAPSLLAAKPAPGYTVPGFRLFTRAAFRWVGNRTQCFLSSAGQICTAESSVTGGGYWPAGTNNQYIFNTGLQVAGRVDPNSAGNSWAGDIDGAFFFNARGGGNGQQITEIWNSADPADLANWPASAYVPCAPGVGLPADANGQIACSAPGDLTATLYDPALQGQKTASDNDIWFLSWEGDPSLSGGRTHPLGLLVETRGLAYNTPGKNDMMFFIYTFYNVTAGSGSGAYANAPARIRSFLEDAGDQFLALNRARGATLPDAGYTMQDMFLAFGADMDVTFEESGTNYASVNVPMAMGYTYHSQFTAPGSWTFDPTIYQNPFFAGAGFIGVKYLKSPEINGQEVGLTLFGATTNGGEFTDPRNTAALYRYLTGNVDPSQGDSQCNVGNVQVTKICYIRQSTPFDMRFFQASGPLTLAPGEYSSIAVAYIYAAPVKAGACSGPNTCGDVRPQQPTGSLLRMQDPATAQAGVNTVDTMTGWRGYKGDFSRDGGPANGVFDTYDIDAVPNSLLGKAQVAQEIFDKKFVQPTPPKAPNFFLIPGDRQVTVVWQPSDTETEGDPFSSASDPNYRKFDVAGYRVYRASRPDANALQLLAQFDHQGDVFTDVTGQVNAIDAQGMTDCAPDLALFVSCTSAGQTPGGVNIIQPIDISLDGPITQYRAVIPSGTRAYATSVDTALTGANAGFPALSGTGVPFIFVDQAGACSGCGVTNGQNYFYMVTAFDINSVRSGPSSLESNLSGAKRVVPQRSPSNTSSTGSVGNVVVAGRNGPLPAGQVPTIDPATGRFSGPFPPADGATIGLSAFLPQLLPAQGAVQVLLEDIELGSAYDGVPNIYHWGAISGTDTFRFTTSITQDVFDAVNSASGLYEAVNLDPVAAARYGGGAGYKLLGSLEHSVPGNYHTNSWGRGCVNAGAGFVAGACDYNGGRWFDGPSPQNNETKAHPNEGNAQNFTAPFSVNTGLPNNTGWNNAGALTGVDVIHQVVGYQTIDNTWREVEGVMGGAKRAADYNVYWNATTAGLIDSVVDVTHNVVVPFDSSRAGPTWGLLTQAAAQPSGVNVSYDQRAELSLTDFGCVEPWRSYTAAQGRITCGTAALGDGPTYEMVRQASLGAIVHFTGTRPSVRTSAFTGQGFAMYIAGNIFMFQLTALPQGTVWSFRDYVGAIGGGVGFGGDDGPYSFAPVTRPFAAAGASLQLGFTTANTVTAASKKLLERVHPVPDPYYVTTSLEPSTDTKIIKFINLPNRAIIRIYSASGVLVRVLEHNSSVSNELTWDVRNRNGQFVASGVYFYHIEAGDARRVGRMTIVNFAK